MFGSGPFAYLSSLSSVRLVGTRLLAASLGLLTASGIGLSATAQSFPTANLTTSTLALTANPATSTYGSIVTLTATANNTAATGTVSFSSNGTTLGSGTLSGGVATLTATGLPVGTDTILATYSGDTGDTASTSNSVVVTVAAATTAVSSTSATQQVAFNFTSTVTLNTTLATAIQVLTQGAANLDFKYASGGSCAAGATYSSGQSCTVDFTFTPTRASTRPGAVILTDSSGNTLATSYVSGLGTGPQVAFPPVSTSAVTTTLASGAGNVEGVAVDGSGDVFYTLYGNSIAELVAVGGVLPASPVTRTFTATNLPQAVAVDGAGNLYVAEYYGTVAEYVAVGGTLPASPVIRTFSTGFVHPQAIAVDARGNVYVGDAGNNMALELSPVNGIVPTGATPTSLGSFTSVFGVAVDAAGDLFVSSPANNSVTELLAVGGQVPASPTTKTVGSNFNSPFGLSVDALGNVYVSDGANHFFKEVVAVSGAVSSSSTVLTLGSGFAQPINSAVDANGNLYVADNNTQTVREFNVVTPAALSFASTAVGSTSAAQTVNLENIGNASLSIASVVSSTANFTGALGTCPGTLASDATCAPSFTFTPQTAAANSATGNITDNNLNASNSVQPVTLSGTGTVGTKTIAFPQPTTPVVAGTSATLTASTSDGDPVVFTITAGTATISGTTTTNGTTTATITYTNTGTVTIAANSAATANAAAAATVSQSVTVAAAPASFTAPTTAVGTTSATQTVEVTFSTAGTPSTISVLTQGATGLDYAFVSGGNCSTSTAYSVGQSCTVQYTLTPNATGPRYGAVVLNSGATVLGTSYLGGVGTGPVAGFTQSSFSGAADGVGGNVQYPALVLGGMSPNPTGTANVLYIPNNSNVLYKDTIGTGTASFYTGAGSARYRGAGVDGAGNVYVSDVITNKIFKLSSSGTLLATWPVSGVSLSTPYAMVFGTDGTLYVANPGANDVVALTPAGVASVVTVSGYSFTAYGLAIDSSNNLYIADNANSRILKVPGNSGAGGAAALVSVTGTAISGPDGVAIDSAGELYVTEGTSTVLRISAAGVSAAVPETGLSTAAGVVTDNRGHIYVTDAAVTQLFTLTLASPPALSFGSVAVGSSSAAQTVTLLNSGNASLSITSVTASAVNFTANAGPCPASLSAGSTCSPTFSFTPQTSGSLSANGVVTGNSLNVSGATQTVALSGTGTAQQPTITAISPTNGTTAGGTTVTITGTNLTGITAVKFGTVAATSFTVVSNTSITAVSPAGTGTVDITVTNGTYTSITSTADQFAYLTGQTITFTQPATPAFYGSTATLAATGGASGNPITFSIVSGPATLSGTNNSTITYTGAGTVVIAANQAGNGTYTAAPQMTRTVTVIIQSVFVANSTGSVSSFLDGGTNGGTPGLQSTSSGGGIGAAVDGSGYVWSINTNGNGISKFTDNGFFSVSYAGGGTAAATAIAIDGLGKVFVTNGNGTVNALTNAGAAVYSTPIATADTISTPTAIAVDAAGSLWIASAGDNTAVEIIGVAAPVVTPTVNAVINANPGSRP